MKLEKVKYILRFFCVFIFTSCFLMPAHSSQLQQKPNFRSIKDVNEKKKAFFDYMYPYILRSNQKALEQRYLLKEIRKKSKLSKQERSFVGELCTKHRLTCATGEHVTSIDTLLTNIHIIPPSLALAQAANESAWGTSRFAVNGHNYFGQWCYAKGCGFVPSRRTKGATHEVQKFKSVQQGVDSYMRNINSKKEYSVLRSKRLKLSRGSDAGIDSVELANGLGKYSERGDAYIREIKSMIRVNNLKSYDNRFWQEVT